MATKNNKKDGVLVKGTSKADNITNRGNNVSIDAGKGNDTIEGNAGKNVTIGGGAGNDSVRVNQWDIGLAYVYTSGNDTINGLTEWSTLVIKDKYTLSRNDYTNAIVVTVEGKGTITLLDYPAADVNIVSSLAKAKRYNTAWSWTNDKVITGTANDDYVFNGGNNVLINGFEGNDYIEGNGSFVTMNGGKGNDKFFNGDYLSEGGNSILINGNEGDDSITNGSGNGDSGLNVTMKGGTGNDYIRNYGNSATIEGGGGNDYIRNGVNPAYLTSFSMGTNVIINGGAGSDTLENATSANVTISGGAGNDFIYNHGDKATINGGAGNDTISNYGYNSTISAGAGDDTVWNYASEVSINAGDGNDSIYNSDGDNVTISGGKGNDYVYDNGVGTAYVYSAGNDSIYNFDAFDTLVLGSVKVNSSVRADGNVTLKLSNKKTLTLQNYQANKVNIAKSIKGVKKVSVIRNDETNTVVKGTSKNDYIQNYGWSYNVTIAAGKGNDYIDNQAGQVSINAGDGNDSIYNVDNDSTILGGAGNDSIYNYGANISINGGAGNDSVINRGLDNTITGGAGNDHISLEVVGNLIKYASGDGKDTIFGFNESDTLTVSGGKYSTQASGSDVIVKVGKGSILLKDAKGKALNINDTKTTDIITLSDGAEVFRNYFDGVKIKALGGNDSVYNFASNVMIDGDNGNDDIGSRYADNVSINGGAGNDSVWNWARTEWNSDTDTSETVETGDNVTLSGGTGNDYIYNEAGVNVVFQYKTGDGNDTISGFNKTSALAVTGAKYSTKKSGDNVIVTVDKGKITLNGAASLGSVNIDFSKLLTVTDKTSSPVTVAANVKVIDASTRTKAVKITGNKLDNEIFGGTKNDSIRGGKGADKIYGGSGNDTLWGDAGNDSLYGGAGKDTFIYKPGEGTDKIFDYASGDMLKILKTNGKDGGTFTKGTFSKGNLTLAISGGGKVIFDGVSKGDIININGTNHTINGKTFK